MYEENWTNRHKTRTHCIHNNTKKKHTRPTNFCQLLSHFKTTIWRDATTQKGRVSSGKPVPKPTPNATDGRLSPKTVWVLLQNQGGLLVWRPWKRAVNVHKPRPKTSRSTHELNKLKYKSRSDTENTTCNHLAELRNCTVATHFHLEKSCYVMSEIRQYSDALKTSLKKTFYNKCSPS